MKHTEPKATLADIEEEARRLQAQAVASMFRAFAARMRAVFSGASINAGTGRTA